MSDTSLTELRAFTDRFQANAVQNRLAAAGIRAIVTGTDAASAFGMGGAPASRPVRIEVAEEDLSRARQILEQDQQRAAQLGAWTCDQCGEQNEATFDLCWRCNSPQVFEPEEPAKDRSADEPAPITIEEAPEPPAANDGNPYQPVLVGNERRSSAVRGTVGSSGEFDNETLRMDVRRAFLASIAGWFVFPPLLNLYSFYRLLSLPNKLPQDRYLRGQVIAAWFFNLAALIVWPPIWFQML